MDQDGIKPAWPPNPDVALTDLLLEIGPGISTGTGEIEIGVRNLLDWQEYTGRRIPLWQGRLLRRLSTEYLVQKHRARKPECPAPYITRESIVANRDAVSRQLEAAFNGLLAASRAEQEKAAARKRKKRQPATPPA